MAVNTIRFRYPTQSDTKANYSDSVWANCPIADLMDGTRPGILFEDDFTSFPITAATTEGNFGRYAQFSSTGGTLTADAGQGGGLVLASDGDDEGASIRTLATPFKISRATKAFWFEARIKASTITDTKNGFFLGLMENAALTATVPIAAAGTLADQNLVGFHRLEGDGDAVDTVYKANTVTQVTVQADAVTIAADTYVKLGMAYEPKTEPFNYLQGDAGGKYLFSFFANGVLLGTQKQIPSADGTDFPNDVGLGLVLAVLNATGTTPGSATIEKWRAAQLL